MIAGFSDQELDIKLLLLKKKILYTMQGRDLLYLALSDRFIVHQHLCEAVKACVAPGCFLLLFIHIFVFIWGFFFSVHDV